MTGRSRQPVPKSQEGFTEQDQRGSDGHEQQMLNHMDRQEVVVVGDEWRTESDPDQEQPEENARCSPWSNGVCGR